MKISTYNAASVRARLPRILAWLDENQPDILAIQETKVEDELFPREEFAARGYHLALNGQKGWNGVALLSKTPLEDVRRGFDDEWWPNDARVIAAETAGISIINTYVPNGTEIGSDKFEYKLRWMERLGRFFREHYNPAKPVIWLGDINVAPTPLDVYDSPKLLGGVGHHPEEFSRLHGILEFGFMDAYRLMYPEVRQYTFWDFTLMRALDKGLGWRIDHIYVTDGLKDRILDCQVDMDARRGEKPSDHTYVTVELSD